MNIKVIMSAPGGSTMRFTSTAGIGGTAITASARILAVAGAHDVVVCTRCGKVAGPEAGGRRRFGR